MKSGYYILSPFYEKEPQFQNRNVCKLLIRTSTDSPEKFEVAEVLTIESL